MREQTTIIARLEERRGAGSPEAELEQYVECIDADGFGSKSPDRPALTDERVRDRAIRQMPYAFEMARFGNQERATECVSRLRAWLWLLGADVHLSDGIDGLRLACVCLGVRPTSFGDEP